LLQDLVMNIADGKSEAPDFERQFLGELSEEVVSFRTAFESLVRRLGSMLSALLPSSNMVWCNQRLPADDDFVPGCCRNGCGKIYLPACCR
jgi:hypothetical protein